MQRQRQSLTMRDFHEAMRQNPMAGDFLSYLRETQYEK